MKSEQKRVCSLSQLFWPLDNTYTIIDEYLNLPVKIN